MSQFTHNGVVYEELPDGNVRVVSYANQPPPDPSFPHQGAKAAAEASNAGASAAVNQATIQPQIDKAVADAIRAQRAGKTEGLAEGLMWDETGTSAIPIPGAPPKKEYSDVQRADAIKALNRALDLDKQISRLRELYEAGPGATSGIRGAVQDNLPLTRNKRFDEAGNQTRAMIRDVLGFTGTELNTPKEIELNIGSYIPSASDRDEVIEDKLAQLEAIRDSRLQGIAATLGGFPDPSGKIVPIPQGEQPNALLAARIGRGEGVRAAGFGATTTIDQLPPEMQAEYGAFLQQWIQNPDPQSMLRFRTELDRKYGYVGDPQTYLSAAESMAEAIRQGGATISPTIPGIEREMRGTERLNNMVVNNPLGAGVAGYADMAMLGVPSALAGQDRMAALSEAQPVGTTLGQIGGAITGTGLIGRAGREAAKRALPGLLGGGKGAQFGRNLATDVAYSGGYGAVTGQDPLETAALGGVGSAGGQLLGKGLGTAIGGLKTAPGVEALRARGIPMTVGQQLGGLTKRAEDAAVSWPVVGDMIRRRTQDSYEGLSRAMFEEGGQPIGFRPSALGREGVEQFRTAKGRAYDDATAGVSVPGDAQFGDDIAATERKLGELPFDVQQRGLKLLRNHSDNVSPALKREGEGRGWTHWSYRTADGRTIPVDTYPVHNSLEVAIDPNNLENANRFGFGEIRRALPEIKREFPEMESVFGERISGANPGRVQEISLAGVQPAPFGMLTGEQYQRAMRGLKTARGKAGTVAGEFEEPYREALSLGMDAFDGLMRRGGGEEVVRGLDAANAANKNFKIIENAVLDRARVGTRSGHVGLPAPSQWVDAARASERKFGANPLLSLAEDAQRVLPSSLPNSGTTDRALVAGLGLAGLGAVGGGEAYATGNIDNTAKIAAALALLSAGGTRAGQQALTGAIIRRPEPMARVGNEIGRRSGLFGNAALPFMIAP